MAVSRSSILIQSIKNEELILHGVSEEVKSLYSREDIPRIMRRFRRNKNLSESMIGELEGLSPEVPSDQLWSLLGKNVKSRLVTLNSYLELLNPDLAFNKDPELEAFTVKRQRAEMNKYWDAETKRFKDETAAVIRESIRRGMSVDECAQLLSTRLGVSSSRALRIARDQTLKAGTRADSLKQKRLGIKSFVWTTVGDSHVRHDHVIRDGRTYFWSSSGEKPGDAINCRCRGLPLG